MREVVSEMHSCTARRIELENLRVQLYRVETQRIEHDYPSTC